MRLARPKQQQQMTKYQIQLGQFAQSWNVLYLSTFELYLYLHIPNRWGHGCCSAAWLLRRVTTSARTTHNSLAHGPVKLRIRKIPLFTQQRNMCTLRHVCKRESLANNWREFSNASGRVHWYQGSMTWTIDQRSLSTRAIATMMMNFLLMQVYNLLMMWMILCVHCWMEYAGSLLLCWRRNGWFVHGKWIIMLGRREKSSWACAAAVAADIRLVLIVYSICLKFNVCMLHCTIFTMMPSTICGL